MTFLELVNKRHSERAYIENAEIDKNIFLKCLEAARLAPSACNSQPWRFIIVDNLEIKNQIAQTTTTAFLPLNHFTKQASAIVVVVNEGSNLSASVGNVVKDKDFSVMDIGIAVEHFCLQAVEEGLGTCILGWFDEKKIKQILEIPKNKRVELLITLGYPKNDKEKTRRKRKDLEQIYSYNKY